MWPSYLYNGNPYTGKTASLYWDGRQVDTGSTTLQVSTSIWHRRSQTTEDISNHIAMSDLLVWADTSHLHSYSKGSYNKAGARAAAVSSAHWTDPPRCGWCYQSAAFERDVYVPRWRQTVAPMRLEDAAPWRPWRCYTSGVVHATWRRCHSNHRYNHTLRCQGPT